VRIALTIAGSDSGGGAGIQADLKTFHQFGVFGTSVVCAVTAQNTLHVRGWEPVAPALVTAQIDAVADDLPPEAVKTGMLGTAENVDAVADALIRRRFANYVLDPVMISTSGDRLLTAPAEARLADRLIPLATLVTPNLAEAARLAGMEVATPEQMAQAGKAILRLGAQTVLVTGGHLSGDQVTDVLVSARDVHQFTHIRIPGATHGTGCTLSAAVAAGLALGRPLLTAIQDALDFVQRGIAAAPGLGAGPSPLNHFVPAPPRPPTEGL